MFEITEQTIRTYNRAKDKEQYISKLARMYQCTEGEIRKGLNRAGVKDRHTKRKGSGRKPALNEDHIEFIKYYLGKGVSATTIAESLGVSCAAISWEFKMRGIELKAAKPKAPAYTPDWKEKIYTRPGN